MSLGALAQESYQLYDNDVDLEDSARYVEDQAGEDDAGNSEEEQESGRTDEPLPDSKKSATQDEQSAAYERYLKSVLSSDNITAQDERALMKIR